MSGTLPSECLRCLEGRNGSVGRLCWQRSWNQLWPYSLRGPLAGRCLVSLKHIEPWKTVLRLRPGWLTSGESAGKFCTPKVKQAPQ